MTPLLLLAFTSGAAYECGCVMWVNYAEKNQIPRAIGWSCFNALVTCIGVESFLKGWPFVIAYVVGYGVGTWGGIRIKRRLKGAPMTPSNRERAVECVKGWGRTVTWEKQADDVAGVINAAVADATAELRAALERAKERDDLRMECASVLIDEGLIEAPHEDGCPEDDTCDCKMMALMCVVVNGPDIVDKRDGRAARKVLDALAARTPDGDAK